MIESKRVSWGWHVARMGEERSCRVMAEGNERERIYVEEQDVNERIIYKWTLKK
jgi:hypothetical protein